MKLCAPAYLDMLAKALRTWSGVFVMLCPAVPSGTSARIVFAVDFSFSHLLCWSGCTLRRLLHGKPSWWTSIFRTYCASSAAPLGDFCTDSLRGRLRFFALIVLVRLHP
jgi:hypothetical protein